MIGKWAQEQGNDIKAYEPLIMWPYQLMIHVYPHVDNPKYLLRAIKQYTSAKNWRM